MFKPLKQRGTVFPKEAYKKKDLSFQPIKEKGRQSGWVATHSN